MHEACPPHSSAGIVANMTASTNYQVARALFGKGRNAGEGAAGLSKSSAKKNADNSAVKKAKPKK